MIVANVSERVFCAKWGDFETDGRDTARLGQRDDERVLKRVTVVGKSVEGWRQRVTEEVTTARAEVEEEAWGGGTAGTDKGKQDWKSVLFSCRVFHYCIVTGGPGAGGTAGSQVRMGTELVGG
ncbi:hypothetical protein V492_06854 [Pseudogymnoascus sp. VKM F-4246]|nr:hypothetical protein V492_06854 [Pseudogymnoascus sp. VKM F-4246]